VLCSGVRLAREAGKVSPFDDCSHRVGSLPRKATDRNNLACWTPPPWTHHQGAAVPIGRAGPATESIQLDNRRILSIEQHAYLDKDLMQRGWAVPQDPKRSLPNIFACSVICCMVRPVDAHVEQPRNSFARE
jgi:hypothetical protein